MKQLKTGNDHAGAQSLLTAGLGDPEIKAMAAAVEYMESANEKSRRRFLMHLHHRYWESGGHIEFEPPVRFNMDDIKISKVA